MFGVKNLCELHTAFYNRYDLALRRNTQQWPPGLDKHAAPLALGVKKQQSPKPHKQVGSGLIISLSLNAYAVVHTDLW